MPLLAACVAVTAILGARYAGQSQAGWLDAALGVRVRAALGGHPRFLTLVWLGDPAVVAVAVAVLSLGCLHRGWRRGALLAAVGIPAAGVLSELVLKPLIDRTFFGGLAFPSGHATGAFAIAVVIAVLQVNPPRPRFTARVRALLAAAALGTAGLTCAAVLGANHHYATDLVGGAAVATAVVLLTALLLDRLSGRLPARLPR